MVVNNQLITDYASKPVVIIGYDDIWARDSAAARRNRYKAADPESPVTLPHLMVDSGRQTSRGGTKDQAYYLQKFRNMINSELGRAPQAAVSATYKRVGNHFEFTVKVTNQSGKTLSSSVNGAMVHAVVYETFTNANRPKDLTLVNNFVRVAAYKSISQSLANNATGTYTLVTADLPNGVNWSNLRMLTMVDYRPGGTTGAYDMLQAAFATPAGTASSYSITPNNLSFLVSSKTPVDLTKNIQIDSDSPTLTWNISEAASWLSVNPASGSAGTQAAVTVSAAALTPGTQKAAMSIQLADSSGFSQSVEIPVTAYLGEVRQMYLPGIRR